ncbi:MAG: NUDIX hydrolase, partial [Candidatus Omnitrophica bacterium]|nr:NUDIX hydrolase [Candidatus Omnitrophota bacterium]
IRFLRHDGWEYVERNNCRGIVIILALTEENKIVLIDQYRAPVRNRVVEFPAGLISDEPRYHKESIASAAKRELLEETGYRARRIVKLLAGPVSSGFTADIVTVVRAYGLRKVAQGGGDHTESIRVHEVPLAKVEQWLKQMSRKGYLIEPKVYMGLFFLAQPDR